MGLWLYLRGRNRAAQRARMEALAVAAAAAKKQAKKEASLDRRIQAGDLGQHGIEEKSVEKIWRQEEQERQTAQEAATFPLRCIYW